MTCLDVFRDRSSFPLVRRRSITVMLAGVIVLSTACERARDVGAESGAPDVGWLGYNDGHDGQRFSRLNEIDTANVAQLTPVCDLRLGEEGPFQTGPVVVGDTMFLTTAHTTVAMNAATCAVFWRHIDSTGQQDPISVNRGVAYLDGKVVRGMPGTRLAALEAATGRKLWDVKIGNIDVAEFVSSAPIAWRGMIFVGLAGGDWGIRGRVMGYDAATGEEKWRFWTIPMGNERGAETWRIPETASRGGGGTWTTYTLDTLSGELFVPVGNPAPDFAPDARPGDNLFTNSIVVLDAATGALKWWFQATPADGFDYDLGAAPMLYTTPAGEGRVAIGSKDGHVYGVHRETHRELFKTPVTTILNADKRPTPGGLRACPGPLGGVEWNGPAYDTETNVIYVGSVDWCATFFSGEDQEDAFEPGQLYMGTRHEGDSAEKATGWVMALDGNTGAVKWRFQTPAPVVAGVTPTAGGLLFTGDIHGNFYALNKNTGEVLFRDHTGGGIAGGIVTYRIGGRQYVATTSGNISRSTFQTTGSPRVIVLAVDAPPWGSQSLALAEVISQGMLSGAPDSVQGRVRFEQFCAGCHGTQGEGGANGPPLANAGGLEEIIGFIHNPNPPMPKLSPSPLDDEAVERVARYVQSLQTNAQQRGGR